MSSSKSSSSSSNIVVMLVKGAVKMTEWTFMTAIPWIAKSLTKVSSFFGELIIKIIETRYPISPKWRKEAVLGMSILVLIIIAGCIISAFKS